MRYTVRRILLIVCLFLCQGVVYAQDREVTNGSGASLAPSGSLREVIASSTTGDRILFAPGVGTVILDSSAGYLSLTGKANLTITGALSSRPDRVVTITSTGPWDVHPFSGNETGSGLTLSNLRFANNTIVDSITGRGLVSLNASSGSTSAVSIASLGNTSFVGNTVGFVNPLQGGGMVGARSDKGNASLAPEGGIAGSFGGNKVTTISDSLSGGGLVGASVWAGTGTATVGAIASSAVFGGAFGKNIVTVGNYLHGGGLVGARSNEGDASVASAGGIAGSFGGNEVTTQNTMTGNISGGGLVGASVWTGTGTATVGAIASSAVFGGAFGKNIVTAETILQGGGLVGAGSEKGNASVASAGGIAGSFGNNEVKTKGTGGYGFIYGGGLVGASVRYTTSTATIGDIASGAVFGGNFGKNSVTVANNIQGGGLVGARSNEGNASVASGGGIAGSFGNNEVTTQNATDGYLLGGGLVGASVWRSTGTATVGDIASGAVFGGSLGKNSVTVETYLHGGGLVGARSDEGNADVASAGGIAGSFGNNEVKTTNGSLYGGGLVGVSVNAGTGSATVGDIGSGAVFGGSLGKNSVKVATFLQGGGLVGARSQGGLASIGTIKGTFADNSIQVGSFLWGGGVIGAIAYDAATGTASLGGFNGARFTGNRVVVGADAGNPNEGWALGGVAAVSGLAADLTVHNTRVVDNTLNVATTANRNAEVVSGAVYIGTDRDLVLDTNSVIVSGNTLFSGNSVKDAHGKRNNSFHFGREWDALGGAAMRDSQQSASLALRAGAGETVQLLDPVSVDINNGHSFALVVDGHEDGRVVWGGVNHLNVASVGNAKAVVRATSGTLALIRDFSLNKHSVARARANAADRADGVLDVSLDNTDGGLSLVVELDGRDAALPMFATPDSFTVSKKPGLEVVLTTFDPDAVPGRWLVTDARQGVDEFSFAMTGPNFLGAVLSTDGDSLYVSTTRTVGDVLAQIANKHANITQAFTSRALAEAWNSALANDLPDLSLFQRQELFNGMFMNPLSLTPEAHVSRGAAALASMGTVRTEVLRLANAGGFAPGGRARADAADVASGPVAATDAYASPSQGGASALSFWGGYLGRRSDMSSRGGLAGFDTRMNGAALGVSYRVGTIVTFGAFGSYGREHTSSSHTGTSVETDIRQLGLCAEFRPTQRLGLRADLSYAWLENTSCRTSATGRYGADYDQRVTSAGVSVGYDFLPGCGLFRLTPYADLRYSHLRQESVRERAQSGAIGALATILGGLSANSFATSLGLEAGGDWRVSTFIRLLPTLRAAWTHEFGDATLTGIGGYAGSVQAYTVRSTAIGRNVAEFGAALRARLFESGRYPVELRAGYDVRVTGRYTEHTYRAGVAVSF